jgi:hypothetical protein
MIGAVGLGLVLAAFGSARADEEYDELAEDFEAAQDAWYELRKQAKEDDESSGDASKLPPHPAKKFMNEFKWYAENRAGRPEAIPALVWIVRNASEADVSARPSPAPWALDRLTEDHAAQAEIQDALPKLKYAMYVVDRTSLIRLYQRVIRENERKEVLALATFNLAFTLYQASPGEESDEDSAEADRRRAKKLFNKVARAYPDTDAAKDAKGYLFEIDNLQVGMVAPDFEGTDTDGRVITLSQFRGQVVVVNFWGFW